MLTRLVSVTAHHHQRFMRIPTRLSGLPRVPVLVVGLVMLGIAPEARSIESEMGAAVVAALKTHATDTEYGPLTSLYQRREMRPLWIRGRKSTDEARDLIANLALADTDGLQPEDYRASSLSSRRTALNAGQPSSIALLAAFDVDLTLQSMHFVHDLHFGRIIPKLVGFELDLPRPPFNTAALLTKLAAGADGHSQLGAAAPQFYHYRLLKEALSHYRQLAQQDAVVLAHPKRSLKLGDLYESAVPLRALLRSLGDLDEAPAAPTNFIDAGLVTALARFQGRHGFRSSGILDLATFQALTTPLATRVQQIELTLERWRWLPEFSAPPVIVNIPQFRLFAFNSLEDRKNEILQMDVIVGRTFPSAHTPVFMATMSSVIFRPYWQVPFNIVKREIVPHALHNTNYLASEGLEIVPANDEGSTPLPLTAANIALLASGQLRLRQPPGPTNALGLVKFSLPNPHDVYLHSTPTPALFQQPARAFSHGCIRVSDPITLAVHVLAGSNGDWNAERVSAAMHGDKTLHVTLSRPVPVLILYGTALATEDGKISFFKDIYGHDAKLLAELTRVKGSSKSARDPDVRR